MCCEAELDTAIEAEYQAKQLLSRQYDQLKHYATALDSDTAPIKIRFEQAC